MNSEKPLQWAGIVLGLSLVLYFTYSHLQYFGNVSFLGGILLLEVIIASLWKYDQRFFVLLMITFVWAGIHVPLQGAGTVGRWVVLSAGAVVGYIIWAKNPRRPFGSLHLIAFFCICAAFVSATVSPWIQMASFKALSLFLLFLYCASGARLAVLGREKRFFHGLLWGSEIAVYITAICYFVLGQSIWGNPNSLGAAMSIGVFPILLWGWLTSDGPTVRFRRLAALLLCTYLVHFSMARAGMVAVAVVTLVFCFCLHQYKLLVKVVALVLFLVALTGMWNPEALNKSLGDLKDAVLYKGHKEEGVMGSRRTPWEKSIATIKEHPWFGTGYGTSPTGEDPGFGFGKFASSAETAREHGSSYITIAEWVGLLGVLPFVALLAVTVSKVWKVCTWMKRTADPRHYSIPLAMVVLSGLVHANFEDWLFAAGSYLCVYFWFFAFLLADLVPDAVAVPVAGAVSRASRPTPAGFGAVVPNR
ncbi:MAG TPA: O-antigen ligase family protein [Terriglobales bacterium]|nr:O-antigen ligase family protein [Terriglobales bacterium]